MKPPTSRCLLGALLLLGLPAFAQAQVWIVLGSFQNQAKAEAEAKSGKAEAFAPLRVAGFDTPKGRFHRVLAGPFGGRGEAKPVLEGFREQGYSGAWLLVAGDAHSSEGAASLVRAQDEAEVEAFAGLGDEDDLGDWGLMEDLEGLEGLESLPDLPGLAGMDELDDFTELLSTPPAEPLLPAHPPLVSEPPPGYELHKLRRSP